MRRQDREVFDPSAILAIIEAADSCCLGLIDDTGPRPLPYLVALNFGYEPAGADGLRGTFWFHGASEGKKLELISRNPQATVQLDGEHEPVKHVLSCGWGMKFASVVATGKAQLVYSPVERRRGLECLMSHYLRLWGPPEGLATTDLSTLPIEDSALAKTVLFRMDVETLCAKRKS